MDLPKTSFEKAIMYLPKRFYNAFYELTIKERSEIQEIRLMLDKPVCIVKKGRVSSFSKPNLTATSKDIEECINFACEYSVHSYASQLASGYITVSGGHRIGICGTAVSSDNKIISVKNISGLNIRIARQIIGCAEDITEMILKKGLCGTLIAGPPSSGKTTVLRDISRKLGGLYKVSVIDERSEIAATYKGKAQNDVGKFTDVFDSYDKPTGIEIATRVMSPDIIICDEIGTLQEAKKIEAATLCGVKMISSVHAGTIKEIYKKAHIKKLIDKGIFEMLILLGTGENTGNVIETEVNGVKTDRSGNFDNYRSFDRQGGFRETVKAL